MDVAVGQMRAIEFDATEPGDWAFHCHKGHHTMNAMDHDVPTMIGVPQEDLAAAITDLIPDYMTMGSAGMAEMGAMEMPLPDNTLPMMTGTEPFGPIEMGGMFTTVKIREGLARGDYADPGAYRHPAGQVAYEWTGESRNPIRAPMSRSKDRSVRLRVRKPRIILDTDGGTPSIRACTDDPHCTIHQKEHD